MSNAVQLRRSLVPGAVPLVSDLIEGQLGLNIPDRKLFMGTGTEVIDLLVASNIGTDSTHRFVTDADIAKWNVGYVLPTASDSVLGGVKIGANIDFDAQGVISLAIASATKTGLLSSADWNTFNSKQNALGFTPVNKDGDSMGGNLKVPAALVAQDATNLGQVTGLLSQYLGLGGGTLTGPLTLHADPVGNLDAATKQFVVGLVDGISGKYAAPVQTLVELGEVVVGTLHDKQVRLVESTGAIWRFDFESVDPADGVGIIEAFGGTGRWVKTSSATQDHNMLKGLQGGATGDYLHLTTAQMAALNGHLTDVDKHLTAEQNAWLDAITASAQEVNYLSGVTSNIQTQLDSKQANIGYVPVNKAGDTEVGSIALKAGETLTVGRAPVAANEVVNLSTLQNYTIDGGYF